MPQGWSRVAKEEGGGVNAVGGADNQGSRSCDLRSEVIEHTEALRRTGIYADVDECRLRPLGVRECTVEIRAGLKPETAPEKRTGYEGRAPIPTDVRGCD